MTHVHAHVCIPCTYLCTPLDMRVSGPLHIVSLPFPTLYLFHNLCRSYFLFVSGCPGKFLGLGRCEQHQPKRDGCWVCRLIIHTLREPCWHSASKKDSFWAWSLYRWIQAPRQRLRQAWEKKESQAWSHAHWLLLGHSSNISSNSQAAF